MNLARIKDLLLKPSPLVTERREQSRAIILSSLSLAGLAALIMLLVIEIFFAPSGSVNWPSAVIEIASIPVVVAGYLGARSRWHQHFARLFTIWILGAALTGVLTVGGTRAAWAAGLYVSLALFSGSFLLRAKELLVVAVCIVIGLALIGLNPEFREAALTTGPYNALVGAVLVILRYRADIDQRDLAAAEASRDAGLKRLESVLRSMPDAILVVDQELKIRDAIVPAAFAVFDGGKSSLIGRPLATVLLNSKSEEAPDPWDLSWLEAGGAWECKFLPAAGLQCEVRSSPYGEGNLLLLLRNVTTLRDMERELESKQQSAESASRLAALGVLAAGVAHEICNPLAVIHGKAELMTSKATRGDYPQAIKGDAEVMLRNVDRIVRIVASMRALSESDEGGIRPQVLELWQVVGNSLSLLQDRLHSHGIKLKCVDTNRGLSSGPTHVTASLPHLNQIIANLLSNAFDAVEAVERSEAWVEIVMGYSGGHAYLAVQNGGEPIPDVIVRRMFEPFFTTKPAGRGTGLGLSVSVQMARAMGGDLTYDRSATSPRFELRLPRATNAVLAKAG